MSAARVTPAPAFFGTGFIPTDLPSVLRPHNCSEFCPSCGAKCSIQTETTGVADRHYHNNTLGGHIWGN